MDESNQALQERIRRYADRVPLDLPLLEPVVRRGRTRRRVAAGVAAGVVLLLAATLVVSLRALLPLGQGESWSASGSAGTYVLSHFEVQYPYMGPGGDGPADPSTAGVLFAAEWSGVDFPGEAQCTLHVFDAAGRELGSLPFGLENTPRVVPVEDAHALAVPIEGGTPFSASGSCGPGAKPTGDYVFSNVRVRDGRLFADVRWGSEQPAGTAWCTVRFKFPNDSIQTEHFTLSSPEHDDEYITGVPDGATLLSLDCEPFTGEPPQES